MMYAEQKKRCDQQPCSDNSSNDSPFLSKSSILKRSRAAAAAASKAYKNSSSDNSSCSEAEYRCLETGAFLQPTIRKHPWYRRKQDRAKYLLPDSTTSSRSGQRWVLDLGCGFAADGRQMLVDGFATHIVGVDRNELYIRLGCELFGDVPDQLFLSTGNQQETTKNNTVRLMTCDVADMKEGGFAARLSKALETNNVSNNCNNLYFDAVYSGKFLHCLETEENFCILLRELKKILVSSGAFFGVFGRNFSPKWECAERNDFERVLVFEGFRMGMMKEEKVGATWFCAYKQ